MTEPNEHTKSPMKPVATFKKVQTQWYVDVTVPHPHDPDQAVQLVSIPVPSEWWADFLTEAVSTHDAKWWELFKQAQAKF